MRIARDSAGNDVLAEGHRRGRRERQKRGALSDPLSKSELFPAAILDMIAVAEESNNLEQVLVQIADTNEARTARAVDLLRCGSSSRCCCW